MLASTCLYSLYAWFSLFKKSVYNATTMWAIRSHTISSILQVSCVLCPQPYSKLRSDIIVQWIDKMDIFAFTKQTIIYFFLSFVSSINTLRIPEIAMFNILCFTMMKRINSTPSLNAYPVERRKSHSGGRHGSKTRCNKLSSHPINWTLPCTWSGSNAKKRSRHGFIADNCTART